MSVEVVNRDGEWLLVADDEESLFPDREKAVAAAEALTDEPVAVVHERSAEVSAKITMERK